MENFSFAHPTRVYFGRGVHTEAGQRISAFGKKVLLHYGGGSIKRSGLYDRICASLREAGVEWVELPGVQPNPRLSLVKEGIRLCREQGVEAILAVGGGSVIDSAKAIGVGTLYEGDVWDFCMGKTPERMLPLGVVLTIPAAGSETSRSCVITNEEGMWKRGIDGEAIRPSFALMDPELTYTLPPYQTACGAVDIMAHILERYFTNVENVDLTDRLCEAALCAVIRNTPLALAQPDAYAPRAEIMWAGSLAHDDLLSTGRIGDWASHQMEHELSALYDVAHGAGLAVMIPAWMKFCVRTNPDRFVQFAHRVMAVPMDFEQPLNTAAQGIAALERFFRSIGMPTTLAELGADPKDIPLMADKCKRGPNGTTGNYVPLTRDDVEAIYHLAE